MKLKKWMILLMVLVTASAAVGAITNSASNLLDRRQTNYIGSGDQYLDPLYKYANEVENLLEGTTVLPDRLRLTEIAAPAGDPATNTGWLYVKDAAGASTVYFENDAGVVTALGAGTFAGGNITSDVVLAADGVDILADTTTAHTFSIRGRDINGGVYVDVLRWTNGDTVANVLGSATASLQIISTGLNVSTQGIITGAAGITNTGVLTSAGSATNLNTSGSDAVNIGTTTYTGTVTIGNTGASVAIASSGFKVTTGGAVSGVTTLAATDDISVATGKGLKGSTTNAETVGVYVYDTDGAWVTALLATNGSTPTVVMGNANGTTALTSSDWAISTVGNMTGIGTITADGLFTGSGGETLSGTVSINDSAAANTTSIGGGTTTGTVSIATGASIQSVNIATGGAAKTTALGSTNGTSSTAVQSGSGAVNVNVSNNQPTNINSGTSTGTVTIGGTGAMQIDIGAGGTGAKAINIGDGASTGTTTIKGGSNGVLINNANGSVITQIGAGNTTGTITIGGTGTQQLDIGNGAGVKTVNLGSSNTTSATVINSGTGDMTITSVDDLSILGGSAGSIINIGTNTHGNVINVATDDTAADTINLGSVKDTINISAVNVVRTGVQYVQTVAYAKTGGTGAGWVFGADDAVCLITLAQSQTAEVFVLPITVPLKVGDTITAFSVNGQIDSAGNTATLDADLRKHTEATAGYADASIGTLTQVSKTADYKIVDSKSGLAEVVAADESYYIKFTGTTAATTDIEIASITITVTEN